MRPALRLVDPRAEDEEMTHPAGRIVLGALAVFILWTLVRAFRSGVIYSRGYAFSLDESPMLFTIGVIVHALCAVFLVYLAAGYQMAGFARWLGLGAA
jgi:hypothetical protein